ncbi:MAG: hypothetical protein GY696_25430 [Gammaproteobacteria bacterium]|nr:hypothetical protein [Gammaproteobacteria bacterium]
MTLSPIATYCAELIASTSKCGHYPLMLFKNIFFSQANTRLLLNVNAKLSYVVILTFDLLAYNSHNHTAEFVDMLFTAVFLQVISNPTRVSMNLKYTEGAVASPKGIHNHWYRP